MKQYLDLMRHIRDHGARKSDRTGTGTLSVFGHQMRFDLGAGFPMVTTKKLHLRSIIHELLWFLRGDTNVAYLHEHGVSIWDEWADANGDLGPGVRRAVALVAGARRARQIDQVQQVIDTLRRDPDSRRMIVSAWNVAEIPKMRARALPPAVPVLRGGRAALLPALPAQRRRVPRRAVQHRLLRAADPHGRAAGGSRRRRVHLDRRRLPPVPESPRAGERAARARAAAAAASSRSARRPPSISDYVFEDFEIRGYQSPRGDQGAGGGVSVGARVQPRSRSRGLKPRPQRRVRGSRRRTPASGTAR